MTEILLKVDIEDLKRIYFRDNEQKYFFGPKTERQSIYLVLAIVIYPVWVSYTLSANKLWQFVLGSIFFCLAIFSFWMVTRPIIKRKKAVLRFLHEAENVKTLKFQYNDQYLIHIQDDHQLKLEWGVIDRAVITDSYIWLFSTTNILLPKRSMSAEAYESLSEMIMSSVKNVEKRKD